MGLYGQFCPVARAAEILAGRWTLLLVRELLSGSIRFNELRRGLPRMSPALLVTRLEELERAGILVRTRGSAHPEYHLTPAGRALGPVVEALGIWGRRWLRSELGDEELDADLLMWDIRRRFETSEAPESRATLRFVFEDQPRGRTDRWLVVEGPAVDLHAREPGGRPDLLVRTDLRTMTEVWVGDVPFRDAVRRGQLRLAGSEALRRSLPGMLGLSAYAPVERA